MIEISLVFFMDKKNVYTNLASKLNQCLKENVSLNTIFQTDGTYMHELHIGPKESELILNLHEFVKENLDVESDDFVKTIEQMVTVIRQRRECEGNPLPKNLCMRLINYELHKDLLQYIPHIVKFKNLAIVFVLEFENDELYVDYHMMKMYGYSSVKDFYKKVKRNTEKQHPALIGSQKVEYSDIAKLLPKTCDKDKVILITNETQSHGSTVLLYNGILEELYKRLGNFIIYPCNVHEALAIPFNYEDKDILLSHSSLLQDMVEMLDVNDFLSNTIYFYQDGSLYTCETPK